MKKIKTGLLLVLLAVMLAAAVPMEGKAMGNKVARLCEAIEKEIMKRRSDWGKGSAI